MDNTISIETNSVRIRGVKALSIRLGVSQTHLTRVIRGLRKPGPELKANLERLGIKPIGGKWAEQ